jgi:hypothetical protein
MANETSFDLNLAIQHWRENLAQSPAFRSENLNELESHLRDSIAALQAKGLSAEEAFIIATRRIGPRKALESEFGKVNGTLLWLERGLLILMAAQMWNLAASISAIATHGSSVMALDLNEVLYGLGLQKNYWNRSIQDVFGYLCSQLMMAVAIGLIWWRFIRPRKWAKGLFEKLLHRPLGLALAFFLFCGVFRVIAAHFTEMWSAPIFDNPNFFSQPHAETYLIRWGWDECVIFALLTYFVARMRLRAARA